MQSINELKELALQNADGRHWYSKMADTLAKTYGKDAPRLAALLAVTSPRCHVALNVRRAVALHEYGRMVINSKRLAMTRSVRASVETYYDTGKVNGPKTNPFMANLNGDLQPVTVDTWILRLMVSEAFADDPKEKRGSYVGRVTRLEHVAVQVIITEVAKELGWEPAEVQAALWYASMRIHGRKPVCMAQELQKRTSNPSMIL